MTIPLSLPPVCVLADTPGSGSGKSELAPYSPPSPSYLPNSGAKPKPKHFFYFFLAKQMVKFQPNPSILDL